MSGDTIYALASGRPPAAIAILRISGPQAHEAGRTLCGELPPARQAAVRLLHAADGELLDEALVLRFDAPLSATGEDVVELHCHGGRAVVDAVLRALGAIGGLRLAEPGEFTRRAFENGRTDLTEAEGLADLLEAETESQRKAALLLAEGGLRRQIELWNSVVLALSARAEAAIDYVDDDGVDVDPALGEECAALAEELEAWLSRPRAEPLKEGVRVVLGGPPNSGKSSLLNVLAGSDKAIVTDVPGTTRDQIEVPVALSGVPITFVDTAGLRSTDDVVESIGVERARNAAGSADILLWLGEADDAPEHSRLILVHARADLPDRRNPPADSIAVSSFDGTGLDGLAKVIVETASRLLPAEGSVALNRRQAEAITEVAAAMRQAAASKDILIVADELRTALSALHRLTGRSGVEDVLDHLFGRFCLGK